MNKKFNHGSCNAFCTDDTHSFVVWTVSKDPEEVRNMLERDMLLHFGVTLVSVRPAPEANRSKKLMAKVNMGGIRDIDEPPSDKTNPYLATVKEIR